MVCCSNYNLAKICLHIQFSKFHRLFHNWHSSMQRMFGCNIPKKPNNRNCCHLNRCFRNCILKKKIIYLKSMSFTKQIKLIEENSYHRCHMLSRSLRTSKPRKFVYNIPQRPRYCKQSHLNTYSRNQYILLKKPYLEYYRTLKLATLITCRCCSGSSSCCCGCCSRGCNSSASSTCLFAVCCHPSHVSLCAVSQRRPIIAIAVTSISVFTS